MHISSLPSKFGIGDLGPESYEFAQLFKKSKQHYWSILPLSPTSFEGGNSPYQTCSAFAGNPLLISPEKLVEKRLLPKEIKKTMATPPSSKVNYKEAYLQKELMLRRAFAKFKQRQLELNDKCCFESFVLENSFWLDDYALFMALKAKTGMPWHTWSATLRLREPEALAKEKQELTDEISYQKFVQYAFFSQWLELKEFCNERQIRIIGDMPFYVAYDSVDVWANQDLFSLDKQGKPRFVGGVPPDYFSEDGQLWGNPVYEWRRMEKAGFEWWLKRVGYGLKVYDLLRLDHFRGFIAYWRVSGSANTARKGRWVKVPSKQFFAALKANFPSLPFIAEDLGAIDAPVKEAIMALGIPGMKVLLFSFDDRADNPHLLASHPENAVVYTGTHDTNTARGWFANEASSKQKANFFKQIGKKVTDAEVGFEMMKLALSSQAKLSIVPVQDVLGLGETARMNRPNSAFGNWEWRAMSKQFAPKNFDQLTKVTIRNGRA
jgi:4-alpha-glucanotransferase